MLKLTMHTISYLTSSNPFPSSNFVLILDTAPFNIGWEIDQFYDYIHMGHIILVRFQYVDIVLYGSEV